MYNKVWKWYENKESTNFSVEKIYIKIKLGSYTSDRASIFARLILSGVFSYMASYVKKLGPFFAIYAMLVLCFRVKILSKEDKKVEMYNMFLVVLNSLEDDKNEK